jgi:hypothetical protein
MRPGKPLTKLQLVAELRRRIRTDKQFNPNPNEAAWGYETGVLMTRNEALRVVELLSGAASIRNETATVPDTRKATETRGRPTDSHSTTYES